MPTSVKTVLAAAGDPLEEQARLRLESEFEADFTDVRIHADGPSHRSARAINATAYTFGNHVVFAANQYRPTLGASDPLLRHELGHVVQQRNGRTVEPGFPSPSADAVAPSDTVGPVRVQRQTAESDLMLLTDEQLQAEQLALEAWLQQHVANDASYNRNVAYLTNIHSVQRKRQPARARRAERQAWEKEILKVGAATAVLGGPFLGWLGVGPIASTFLYEFGAGFVEGIDEQPPERKQRLIDRFTNLYFSWGNWGDKYDYTKGYLWGIVLGIWGEIKGIWDLVVLVYEVNKKVNDWLFATGSDFFENWDAMVAKGRALATRIDTVFTKAVEEVQLALKDPAEALKKLQSMLDTLLEGALTSANELGHQAIDSVFGFLEEPFGRLGEDIGKVVGAVIFNIVLLVASDAIGNLIKEGAAFVAKVGKTLFEGVVEAGRAAAGFLTKVVELVRGVGRRILSSETVEALVKVIDDIVEFLKGLVPKVKEVVVPGEEPPVGVVKKFGEGSRMEAGRIEDLTPKEVPLEREPTLPSEPIRPSMRQELDALQDRAAETLQGHPHAEEVADQVQRAERLLADPSRQSEAADAIRDLRRTIDEMEELPMEGRDPSIFEGAGETGLTELEPWDPPEGAAPKPDSSAPPEIRRGWLKERLQIHVDEARARFGTESFTGPQEVALKTDPRAAARFRGSRIDAFAKSTVLRDADLAEVITAPDFVPEPDFIDSILPDWFDATTKRSWEEHLIRYAKTHGTEAALLSTF